MILMGSFHPQYPHQTSPDCSPYIFLKRRLIEFDKRTKHFSHGGHSLNSPNYFYRWCIDVVWEKIDVGHSCFLSVALFLLILISMSGTSEDLTYLMRLLANIKMSLQVMHKKDYASLR